MSSRRRLLLWLLAALVTTGLLVWVLVWRQRQTHRQLSFLAGDPSRGAHLFETKRCIRCHAVNGNGARLAPDLGVPRATRSNLNQLVTAMWNHGPQMWTTMQEHRLATPTLNQEEMADLLAFLYIAGYLDEPGDASRGRQLFSEKGCSRCHAAAGKGGKRAPDLSTLSGVDTPIAWTELMWNHAPAMDEGMQQLGISWPKFEGREMSDLLAFVREVCTGTRIERQLLPASAARGWEVFQSKSCIVCHAVNGQGGNLAPDLAAQRKLPPTMVQFAGVMWNHSPEMFRAMKAQQIVRPTFNGREMADLIAFLYSLRYFEPIGSPHIGQTLFAERGCARCHGQRAEGSAWGPALRGRGEAFTPIALATALWRHGPKMYRYSRALGLAWPRLKDGDVANLVEFLNSPPEVNR